MCDIGSDDLPLLGCAVYDVCDESLEDPPLLGHIRGLNLLNLRLNLGVF